MSRKLYALSVLAALSLPAIAFGYGDHHIYGIHFYGTGAENLLNGRQMYSVEMLYTEDWKNLDKAAELSKYTNVKNLGFTIIMRIDYSRDCTTAPYGDWNARYDFAVQAGDIAAWMKDIVDIYIIGNEMTTNAECGRNAWWYASCYNGYDNNSAYDKIHAADPNATVLLGALTGWPLGNDLIGGQNNVDWVRDVQNYVDQVAGEPQIDGYAVHAYSGDEYYNDLSTDTEDPRFSDITGFNAFIEYLKPVYERHGAWKPVYITETNTYWMPEQKESDLTYRQYWLREACQTIDEWNAKSDLKVDALCWYTFSHFNYPANRDIWGNAMMRTDNWRLNMARDDLDWVTTNKDMRPGYPGGTLHFEAENYTNSAEWALDNGLEGTDYHDVDSQNWGGQYRNGDRAQNRPDIAYNPAYTGFVIGWMEPGEWLRYATIAGGQNYQLKCRYARGSGGTGQVSFSVDGTSVGSISLPSTGGWNNYAVAYGSTFYLAGGFHHITMHADTGATNIDWFEFVPSSPQNQQIVVQTEDYASGGQNVGYYDTTAGNTGGAYRSDDVDIAYSSSEGSHVIGWVDAWEWLKFTNVQSVAAGTYTIEVRVAALSGSHAFNLEANGVDQTGVVWFNATGGWDTWTTINAGTCTLNAGSNELKLVMHNGAWNVNWIRLTPQ